MDNNFIDNEIQASDAIEVAETIEIDTDYTGGYHKNAQGHTVLYDENGYNPKLDPDSPDFDAEYFAEKVKEHTQRCSQLIQNMATTFYDLVKEYGNYTADHVLGDISILTERLSSIFEATQSGLFQVNMNDVKSLSALLDRLKDALTEDKYHQQWKTFSLLYFASINNISIEETFESGLTTGNNVIEGSTLEIALNYSKEMELYVREELKKPKYNGLTWEQLIDEAEVDENDILNLTGTFGEVFKAAKMAKAKHDAAISRDKATYKGALMSLKDQDGRTNLMSFSNKLDKAFTAFSIQEFKQTGQQENYDFMSGDNGQIDNFYAMQAQQKGQLLPANKIDTSVLMTALKMALLTNQLDESNTSISFYLPTICQELGIDVRGEFSRNRDNNAQIKQQRAEYFKEYFSQFENCVGKLPDNSWYRVMTVSSYDAETDTMTINTPYIFKALSMAKAEEKGQEKKPGLPQFNKLFHANIATEGNQAALEVANRIVNGLLHRGTANPTDFDAKGKPIFMYKVKFLTLIRDCPRLLYELDEIEKKRDTLVQAKDRRGNPKVDAAGQPIMQKYNIRQAKNAKLKRTFETAYRIIKQKTDAYNYFENLKINGTAPTQSTLNTSTLIITYTGVKK